MTDVHSDDAAPRFRFKEEESLARCMLCPRNCGVNRLNAKNGFCKSDASFRISAVCIHKGEEPAISGKKGICNIFFPHCNLQCIYCQNVDISKNETTNLPPVISFEDLIPKVCSILDQTENIVGFVSPSHYIPQMLAIIRGIKEKGRNPVVVYNSNGYDKVETLQSLEGVIDIYLPDFKYLDHHLAFRYSRARNYPEVAAAAIKEMYRQKGSCLISDDRGIAQWGLIIRHLVLPGKVNQSIEVLKYIAEEISTRLHVSLMSQYYPTKQVRDHRQLNRTLTREEYQKVTDTFFELGFSNGWTQEMESQTSFRPCFSDDQPFQ